MEQLPERGSGDASFKEPATVTENTLVYDVEAINYEVMNGSTFYEFKLTAPTNI